MTKTYLGPWRPAIRTLAAGTAAAAIGDMHGHADLLAAMHAAIAGELEALQPTEATLVHLGDLVDRGPEARRTIDLARHGIAGVRTVTLSGNHEDRLLAMLDPAGGEAVDTWLSFGAGAVIAELGLDLSRDWRSGLEAGLGPERLAFLKALPASHRVGSLLFVHAGIDPHLPLGMQSAQTMMWIRAPFLNSAGPYDEGVAVIHGHTPISAIDLDHPHRINLDTGAFATGTLSALLVAGDRMRKIAVSYD